MNNIAIFASGSGTNAENLIRFFRTKSSGQVKLVLTNNRKAYVINRAQSLNIETFIFNRDQFYQNDEVLNVLVEKEINFIVLAGFLWLVPGPILKAFEGRMINIHPALLPQYGGKGMYGRHVHEAVIANGDSQSGITIHQVNQKYDEGHIIFQATCEVEEGDTPEILAKKIHALEHEHFPKVIEQLLEHL